MRLALFDLDHTLLSADSDVQWCEFLIGEGRLGARFAEQYRLLASHYDAGTVSPVDYCNFHAATLAGWSVDELRPLRDRFFRDWIRPNIPDDARELLRRCRFRDETLVLTTATNRVVSELTAHDLGVDHYLCTELELVDARYTGRTCGVLNMRSGKIDRVRQWLHDTNQPEQLLHEASFYTDSINDLALLSAVRKPIVVDPDSRLEATALRKGWTVLRLHRPLFKPAPEAPRIDLRAAVPEVPRAVERRARERE
ncbi:MAG TPA: HAD-IB family hydrolase [Burkholderiaceae bacterium]|nr:HAD-IB family hydrolase [Burkholderiaceae bacterium]